MAWPDMYVHIAADIDKAEARVRYYDSKLVTTTQV
jgi:hypothetical protein